MAGGRGSIGSLGGGPGSIGSRGGGEHPEVVENAAALRGISAIIESFYSARRAPACKGLLEMYEECRREPDYQYRCCDTYLKHMKKCKCPEPPPRPSGYYDSNSSGEKEHPEVVENAAALWGISAIIESFYSARRAPACKRLLEIYEECRREPDYQYRCCDTYLTHMKKCKCPVQKGTWLSI